MTVSLLSMIRFMNESVDMPSNLHQRLLKLGYNPECALLRRKILSTSEKGSKYILNMGNLEKNCVVFKVDGEIIKIGNKCDKLVLVELDENVWSETFVELKSHNNINKAITQLECSLQNKLFIHSSIVNVRARIVAHSFPSNRSNPDLEKAKKRFKDCYKCELKQIKSHQPDKF